MSGGSDVRVWNDATCEFEYRTVTSDDPVLMHRSNLIELVKSLREQLAAAQEQAAQAERVRDDFEMMLRRVVHRLRLGINLDMTELREKAADLLLRKGRPLSILRTALPADPSASVPVSEGGDRG